MENRWYQQTGTLKALAEWCIHCAPSVVPTVPRDPYPCMPTAPTNDKVASESGPNSVSCRICQENVPHRVLRTHIGQHILRGQHIEGQATRSCANICGFCGARDECTIRFPLQSRSTRNRMVVAVSSCPSQPPMHNHGLVVQYGRPFCRPPSQRSHSTWPSCHRGGGSIRSRMERWCPQERVEEAKSGW